MIVFKQWHYKPNKRGTPKAILGMMKYIATRDGVEIHPTIDHEVSNKYMQYIATRPGVDDGEQAHGLFGRLQGMQEMGDIENLSDAMSYASNLATNKTNIYNAVISLAEKVYCRCVSCVIEEQKENKD